MKAGAASRADAPPVEGPPVVVVGALASRDGKVLLARRAPGQRHAGAWELPGGKVEPGEEPGAALVRELAEELGVVSHIAGRPWRYESELEGRSFVFLVFPVTIEGEPRLSVHDELAYLRPEELGSRELAPLDEPALADWAAAVAPRPAAAAPKP